MIDQSAILQGDALRAELAAKVAAYEAQYGPVETLPILTTDKRVPFRISCPEKRTLSRQKQEKKGRGRVNEERKQVRAANRERILALSNCKLSTKAIAERTGLSTTTVRSVLKEAA